MQARAQTHVMVMRKAEKMMAAPASASYPSSGLARGDELLLFQAVERRLDVGPVGGAPRPFLNVGPRAGKADG